MNLSKNSDLISIKPHEFKDVWEIPTNKSFANRALIASALAQKSLLIKGLPESTDVRHALSCLKAIGVDMQERANGVQIEGNLLTKDAISYGDEIELNTGEGGTTLRFLLPLLARSPRRFFLRPEGGMKNRPMDELCRVLRELGVEVEGDGEAGFRVKGPFQVTEGEFEVDCSQTTQFLSGLKLASWDTDLQFTPKNLSASLIYLQQTDFVISAIKNHDEVEVPVDFSSASYPLCLGAIRGPLRLSNCHQIDENQADSCFIDVLKSQVGAKCEFTSKGLVVKPPKDGVLRSFEIDGRYSPDLVPTLAVLACFCQGTTRLNYLDVLRHKECDRLEAIQFVLQKLGVDYYLMDDEHLEIQGGRIKNEKLFLLYKAPRDHRMIMVAGLLFSLLHGGEIQNFQYVDKSFPDFFDFLSPSAQRRTFEGLS